jgi:hypothetical protein
LCIRKTFLDLFEYVGQRHSGSEAHDGVIVFEGKDETVGRRDADVFYRILWFRYRMKEVTVHKVLTIEILDEPVTIIERVHTTRLVFREIVDTLL